MGLLTPDRLSPGSLQVAESLSSGPAGLAAIIGLRSAATTARDRRRPLLRRAAGSLRSSVRMGLRGTAAPATARAFAQSRRIAYESLPAPDHAGAVEALRRQGLSVVVCHGAGILRPSLLETEGLTFLNAHAGRLPGYGGMNVVEWAVFRGDPVYGTIHRIDRGIDTGDILVEAPLRLGRPRTVAELRAAAFAAAWQMLPGALAGLSEGRLAFRRQPATPERVQWFRMHPSLLRIVQSCLDDGSFFAVQEACLATEGSVAG